ncbi:hypothetical protein H0H93_008699 [Arthromyces matolae]|nr:hypothetical protein H0H93_008699 [Arthromyces matolae]
MLTTTCRCVVRGSINSDEYFYVRNIARPGETISSNSYEQRVGGKGANQAIAILKAGGVADFYGTIGKDGQSVKDTATRFGLEPNGIIVSDVPTGRAIIQISDTGENSIILFPGANYSQLIEESWAASDIAFPQCTHVLLQNEIRLESTIYALNNSGSATTIYNPSPMLSSSEITEFPWEKIGWLIVNAGEARDLYTAFSKHGPLETSPGETLLLLSALPALQATNIICTLGKDGVTAFIPAFHRTGSGEPFIRLPAAELRGTVRDTTGAGDCFTGYFVRGLMDFGPEAKPGNGITESDIVEVLKACVEVGVSSIF